MKCPHCQEDIKYSERRNRRCPKCQQQFALEPRENDLQLSDLRLLGLARRLSQEETYRYTSLQLAHAAILQKRKPDLAKTYPWPVSRRPFRSALKLFLIVTGLLAIMGIFSYFAFFPSLLSPLWASVIVLVVASLIGLLAAFAYRYPIIPYHAEIESFEQKYIAPWETIHGPMPGRLTERDIKLSRQFQIPPAQVRAVVVSPVDNALACLYANGLPERLGLALINPDRPFTKETERLIAWVRHNPQIPILLVHDASVQGCLLSYLLPAKWELTSRHRIIDLGLRPRHVERLRLPWTFAEETPKELVSLLERAADKPGGVVLDDEELIWLREGPVTSVLFIPPAQLIEVITSALERHAPARMVDPEMEAQAQARAIGFMTWP